MRNVLIALLPAAFVACGAPDTPAAEDPTAVDLPAAPVQTAPQTAPVQVAEAAGTWTQAGGASPRVTFASLEGETLFSVACIAANAESGAPMLQIDSVTSSDAPGERIDVFSSASNATLPAGPATAPGMITGYVETAGTVPFALSRGSGEIKIVSGTRGFTFQTDPMLKDLIDACNPPYQAPVEADAGIQDGEETDQTEAPEGSPSGN